MDIGLKKALLFLSLTFMAACSAEHTGLNSKDLNSENAVYIPNPNPNPALAQAAASILGPKCANCHGSTGSNTRFLNTSGDPDLDSLSKNLRYVQIGQGEKSLLYKRSGDGTMPPGNALTTSEALAIKAWIDDLGIIDESATPPATAAKFSEIEANILQLKCYGCHQNHASFKFSSYAEIMYAFVSPYNLQSSLYTSITRATDPMPKNNPKLSASEIAQIESWIMNGAPNN